MATSHIVVEASTCPNLENPDLIYIVTGRPVGTLTTGTADNEIDTYYDGITWQPSTTFGLTLNGIYVRLLNVGASGDKDCLMYVQGAAPPRGKTNVITASIFKEHASDAGTSLQDGKSWIKYELDFGV